MTSEVLFVRGSLSVFRRPDAGDGSDADGTVASRSSEAEIGERKKRRKRDDRKSPDERHAATSGGETGDRRCDGEDGEVGSYRRYLRRRPQSPRRRRPELVRLGSERTRSDAGIGIGDAGAGSVDGDDVGAVVDLFAEELTPTNGRS